MKARILILFFCWMQFAAFAGIIDFSSITNEVNGTFKAASYDADSHVMSHPFATYFYLINPGFTNHIYSGESSGDWQGNYETLEEKRDLPLWNSFAVPGYDWMLANDNGGEDSNATYSAGINIAAGPPLFFNGFAQTNEGIATVGITHWPIGRLPHDGTDGDSGAIAGNSAATNLDGVFGVPLIDTWHLVWTNGWQADVVGARRLGFSTGSHPYLAGFLEADIRILVAMNVPTNIGSVTFNWGAASASTDHATASGITVIGNTLTATVLFARMPMAWDVPDGTITNDARDAFVADTNLANQMQWTLQVTNLPVGNYTVAVDGSNIVTLTSTQLAAGWNMFTNYNGSLWAQRKEVLGRKRDQAGEDRVTLISHSAGSLGALGNDLVNYNSNGNNQYDTLGKRGSAYVTAMSTFVTDLQKYDVAIWQAAQQTNHLFTITLAEPRLAPFHR